MEQRPELLRESNILPNISEELSGQFIEFDIVGKNDEISKVFVRKNELLEAGISPDDLNNPDIDIIGNKLYEIIDNSMDPSLN
jgi:hypothetical protein